MTTWICWLVTSLCAVTATANGTEGLRFYVSPQGNDTWTGQLASPDAEGTDGPFATLERARDAIRSLDEAQRQAAPITVFLRGGIYTLDRTFALNSTDSGTESAPITYRAYGNEEVRIIGGREITGFEPVTDAAILDRLDPAARSHVLQADIQQAGVTDFGKVPPGGDRFELFFDGRPMTLARWPNDGYRHTGELLGGQPITIHGHSGDAVGKFRYEGDRPERWTQEEDIWLWGYWFWDWADAYQKVERIDTEERSIKLVEPYHYYGYRQGQRYFALNLLSELDEPGEWYLDRTNGLLYFWPPSDIRQSRAFVSVLGTLIELQNVEHVTFRGLTFEFNRGTAVAVQGGQHVRIVGCTIRNIGGWAVAFRGGSDHAVIGCDIYYLGDGGIVLDGGDRVTLTPSRHLALNNHIHHYSRNNKTYRPAVKINGVGQRIAHNLIHDAPHQGMMFYGNEHLIEYNEIHNVCLETDDAGAIYTGRDWTWRGNVIRYNYFHHLGTYKSWVGNQSVYLDDWTSGTTVHGNIVYKSGRGVLIGGGRNNIVDNNVFVECTPSVHVDSRGLGWASSYFDGTNTKLTDRLDAVPYREPPWSEKYPELLTLYDDEPAVAKYNVITRNISVGGRWLDLSDGLNDQIVRVEDNLVDADPLFVDAEAGDFQLRPDSPAFSLGFEPIPVEKIGLYEDEYRATWPPMTDPGRPDPRP